VSYQSVASPPSDLITRILSPSCRSSLMTASITLLRHRPAFVPIGTAITKPLEVEGTCIDIVALCLSSIPINVLTDLAILLLPLPILTSLRMEFREKVILVTTFIVGGFVTIVDVVRIVYLQEALKEELLVNPSASITATTPPHNFTYHASFSLMWLAVEVSVGIMCCSALVLKPLVMCVMPKPLNAPQIHRHLPNQTSDSLLHSNTSERSSDSSHLEDAPSLAWDTQPATNPLSPRAADLSRIESSVSPISPTQPSLSVILRQSTSDEEGETLNSFEMLASEPSAEDPGTWPPLEGSWTRRKSAPRRSTVMSERRATVATDTSQEATQNFFDFVHVKGKVPLTQLSAKEAWWPTMFGERASVGTADPSVHPLLPVGLCLRSRRQPQRPNSEPSPLPALAHHRPPRRVPGRVHRRPSPRRLLGP
jgi:hypothetical protein